MKTVSEELKNKISNEVEERKGELFHLLAELISFPTVSPPARNTNEVQEYISQYLKKLGFEIDKWDVYPGDPNVVGILKGETSEEFKSLIVNGHVDVAEVGDEKEWDASPFQTLLKDSYIYGRGVADMKGGIAASLLAITILKELGIPLRGDLQFQSVIGEEVGEAGTLA
jgi:acetylornithine deacetylase